MAKKIKVKRPSAQDMGISANKSYLGEKLPTARTAAAGFTSTVTTKAGRDFQSGMTNKVAYKPNELLRAKMPADFEDIYSVEKERELEKEKPERKAAPKKKASKKVTPKKGKITFMKTEEEKKKKKGRVTFIKSKVGDDIIRPTANDKAKY